MVLFCFPVISARHLPTMFKCRTEQDQSAVSCPTLMAEPPPCGEADVFLRADDHVVPCLCLVSWRTSPGCHPQACSLARVCSRACTHAARPPPAPQPWSRCGSPLGSPAAPTLIRLLPPAALGAPLPAPLLPGCTQLHHSAWPSPCCTLCCVTPRPGSHPLTSGACQEGMLPAPCGLTLIPLTHLTLTGVLPFPQGKACAGWPSPSTLTGQEPLCHPPLPPTLQSGGRLWESGGVR